MQGLLPNVQKKLLLTVGSHRANRPLYKWLPTGLAAGDLEA